MGKDPIDDKQMLEFIDDSKVAGAVTLLYQNGEIIHKKCFGKQDIERNIPMSINSLFRIYSMTKPIVSTAMMMLYEEGLFQLSDPISTYIPSFTNLRVCKKNDEGSNETEYEEQECEITIFNILTHTSGLTYSFLDKDPVKLLNGDPDDLWHTPLQDFVEALSTMPLAFQPGAKWQYSFATDVLALLVEKISELPIDVFLQTRIFGPLGMKDTGYFVPEHKLGRFTTLYRFDPENGKRHVMEDPLNCVASKEHNEFRGGHGLISTADDYLAFCRLLLGRGSFGGVRLLKEESVSMMTRNHLPPNLIPFSVGENTLAGYGFGLGVRVLMDAEKSKFGEGVGEFGWAGAADSYFWIDPENDMIGISMLQYMPGGLFQFNDAFRKASYDKS